MIFKILILILYKFLLRMRYNLKSFYNKYNYILK